MTYIDKSLCSYSPGLDPVENEQPTVSLKLNDVMDCLRRNLGIPNKKYKIDFLVSAIAGQIAFNSPRSQDAVLQCLNNYFDSHNAVRDGFTRSYNKDVISISRSKNAFEARYTEHIDPKTLIEMVQDTPNDLSKRQIKYLAESLIEKHYLSNNGYYFEDLQKYLLEQSDAFDLIRDSQGEIHLMDKIKEPWDADTIVNYKHCFDLIFRENPKAYNAYLSVAEIISLFSKRFEYMAPLKLMNGSDPNISQHRNIYLFLHYVYGPQTKTPWVFCVIDGVDGIRRRYAGTIYNPTVGYSMSDPYFSNLPIYQSSQDSMTTNSNNSTNSSLSISNGETKLSFTDSFVKQFNDANQEAAKRNTVRSVVKGGIMGVAIAVRSSDITPVQAEMLVGFLSTEMGENFAKAVIGFIGSHLPQFKDHKLAQTVFAECRNQSLEGGQQLFLKKLAQQAEPILKAVFEKIVNDPECQAFVNSIKED